MMTGELHGQVTCEAACGLDQHDADMMFLAMVEQLDETGASIDGSAPDTAAS